MIQKKVFILSVVVVFFSFPISSLAVVYGYGSQDSEFQRESELPYEKNEQKENFRKTEFQGEESVVPAFSTNYKNSEILLEEFLHRTSVFLGYNLSSRLEGVYYSDGSVKNVSVNKAFSMGLRGRIHSFNKKVHLSSELEYNTSRSLDPSFLRGHESDEPIIFSSQFSFFSLVPIVEINFSEEINTFIGLNYSLPVVESGLFNFRGNLGFQGGMGLRILEKIWIEAMVKVNNVKLYNDKNEKRDVGLAGFELRGRHSF